MRIVTYSGEERVIVESGLKAIQEVLMRPKIHWVS